MKDLKSDLINVVNGVRVTTDTPAKYKNTIYTLGPCYVAGTVTFDKNTIASNIQRLVINYKENQYRVVNYGVPGGDNHMNDLDRLLFTN